MKTIVEAERKWLMSDSPELKYDKVLIISQEYNNEYIRRRESVDLETKEKTIEIIKKVPMMSTDNVKNSKVKICEEIPMETFDNSTIISRISKIRGEYKFGEYTIQIDTITTFKDFRPIVIMEIEDSENLDVESFPLEVRILIEKEVTHDDNYSNLNLGMINEK